MIEIGNNLTAALIVASVALAVAAPHLRRKADTNPPPAKPNPELAQVVTELGEIRDQLRAELTNREGR